MGFGGLFLILSYYLRNLWGRDDGDEHGNHCDGSATCVSTDGFRIVLLKLQEALGP